MMQQSENKHEHYMQKAFALAQQAFEEGEVPVGAVVVYNNRIIGKGYNQCERLKDATAHAEMIAITAASEFLNSKYLKDCILYVTLEPCMMCGGAIYWSQLNHIIYGASDPQKGCLSANKNLFGKKTNWISGILKESCSELINQFFSLQRETK